MWKIFYVVELSAAWNVGVLRWKYLRNLELLKVSSLDFVQDFDSKMMVMSVDVTVQVAPELQYRMKTAIWQ